MVPVKFAIVKARMMPILFEMANDDWQTALHSWSQFCESLSSQVVEIANARQTSNPSLHVCSFFVCPRKHMSILAVGWNVGLFVLSQQLR